MERPLLRTAGAARGALQPAVPISLWRPCPPPPSPNARRPAPAQVAVPGLPICGFRLGYWRDLRDASRQCRQSRIPSICAALALLERKLSLGLRRLPGHAGRVIGNGRDAGRDLTRRRHVRGAGLLSRRRRHAVPLTLLAAGPVAAIRCPLAEPAFLIVPRLWRFTTSGEQHKDTQ